MFRNPVHRMQEYAAWALLARLPGTRRHVLIAKLLAEMPVSERQRLIVHSPGFVSFARDVLLSAGRTP